MIQIKVAVGTQITEFNCPKCGVSDTSYLRMPTWCYSCEYNYFFDVIALMELLEARKDYYYRRITLVREDY